ncbi:hypothetical protein Pelo_6367 [Pelomyxa schiedti]|nr:hypothetical protein Pelo_6367 [Pelomyxa schiedti]
MGNSTGNPSLPATTNGPPPTNKEPQPKDKAKSIAPGSLGVELISVLSGPHPPPLVQKVACTTAPSGSDADDEEDDGEGDSEYLEEDAEGSDGGAEGGRDRGPARQGAGGGGGDQAAAKESGESHWMRRGRPGRGRRRTQQQEQQWKGERAARTALHCVAESKCLQCMGVVFGVDPGGACGSAIGRDRSAACGTIAGWLEGVGELDMACRAVDWLLAHKIFRVTEALNELFEFRARTCAKRLASSPRVTFRDPSLVTSVPNSSGPADICVGNALLALQGAVASGDECVLEYIINHMGEGWQNCDPVGRLLLTACQKLNKGCLDILLKHGENASSAGGTQGMESLLPFNPNSSEDKRKIKVATSMAVMLLDKGCNYSYFIDTATRVSNTFLLEKAIAQGTSGLKRCIDRAIIEWDVASDTIKLLATACPVDTTVLVKAITQNKAGVVQGLIEAGVPLNNTVSAPSITHKAERSSLPQRPLYPLEVSLYLGLLLPSMELVEGGAIVSPESALLDAAISFCLRSSKQCVSLMTLLVSKFPGLVEAKRSQSPTDLVHTAIFNNNFSLYLTLVKCGAPVSPELFEYAVDRCTIIAKGCPPGMCSHGSVIQHLFKVKHIWAYKSRDALLELPQQIRHPFEEGIFCHLAMTILVGVKQKQSTIHNFPILFLLDILEYLVWVPRRPQAPQKCHHCPNDDDDGYLWDSDTGSDS